MIKVTAEITLLDDDTVRVVARSNQIVRGNVYSAVMSDGPREKGN